MKTPTNNRVFTLNQAKTQGYRPEGHKWAVGNFSVNESFVLSSDGKIGKAPGFHVADATWIIRARVAALLALSFEAAAVRRRLHGCYVGSDLEHFLAIGMSPA